MRIPWVQCISSLDQYCIHPLIEATIIVTTIVHDRLLYYRSYITLFFSHRYEHGMPASSIYMSHIICISPIDGNHINTKTKIHHALAQESPPLPEKSYDVHRPYDELLPSHIRGKYINQKIPHSSLHGLNHINTPIQNLRNTPLDPHTLKKGLKMSKWA